MKNPIVFAIFAFAHVAAIAQHRPLGHYQKARVVPVKLNIYPVSVAPAHPVRPAIIPVHIAK